MSHPAFVDEKIESIHKRTKIPKEEILRDYQEFFEGPFVQEDDQFKTDDERHRYAIAVLNTRYVNRPPVEERDVIPVGISSERTSRAGKRTGDIYAIVIDRNGRKFRRIVLQGDSLEIRKEIILPSSTLAKYNKVKLGKFEKGEDMVADNRTKFRDPVRLKGTPQQLLDRIKAKRIKKLKDAEKYPSKTGSDGYLDRTDWRIVRGIIIREYRGVSDSGTEYGVYTIADDSLNDKGSVSSDGRVLPPGFTVWAPVELMNYDIESECDFAGTISKSKKSGESQMNTYLIIPIHAKRIPGD